MLPPTIDRLFTASMILTGMWVAVSFCYPNSVMYFFHAYLWASALLVLGHHFWHYRVARRSKSGWADRFAATNGQSKQLYPEHLTGLFNIIFLGFIGLSYVGMMWMPLATGAMNLSGYDLNKDRQIYLAGSHDPFADFYFMPRTNYYIAQLLEGVFGCLEAGVLLAIFGICIRERKASRKASTGSAGSLKDLAAAA